MPPAVREAERPTELDLRVVQGRQGVAIALFNEPDGSQHHIHGFVHKAEFKRGISKTQRRWREEQRQGAGGPSVWSVGRPAKFSSEQILDHAAQLVSTVGPQRVTVGAIAESMGAPSGSIYHRFGTRDLIMARTWIRTVRRAQGRFIERLGMEDVRAAAHGAALHIPQWCRENELDARILLLYRREELAATWPDDLGDELAALNEPLRDAVRKFTPRLPGRTTARQREAVRIALFDVPYGVSRRHLRGGSPPPAAVDQHVVTVCDALLFPEPSGSHGQSTTAIATAR